MGVNGDRARFVLAVWVLRGYDFSMPRIARAILAGYPNKTGSVPINCTLKAYDDGSDVKQWHDKVVR